MSNEPRLAAESSERAVARWLRRKILAEASIRIFEALAFLGVSLVLAAIVSGGLFLMALPLYWHSDISNQSRVSWLTWYFVSWPFLLTLSLLLRFEEEDCLPSNPLHLSHSTYSRRSAGLDSLAVEIFSGMGRLAANAFECLMSACRLLRSDVCELSGIIIWLWRKRRKAITDELFSQFPNCNWVRTLPQLRDIPGIIWLPDPRGVIILSEELRNELDRILQFDGDESTKEREPGSQTNYRAEELGTNAQILKCYEILGLPPYSQMRQVKKRYRQLAKKYHPDVFKGSDQKQAGEYMTQINAAYECLIRLQSGR